MIKFNWPAVSALVVICILLAGIAAFIMTAGCVSLGKGIIKDATATPVPTATPSPIVTVLTTIPTLPPITTIPTVSMRYVDPFAQGERSEGQWFKWDRQDVLGFKDLSMGIIEYRHVWLDRYTWYNPAMAQYYINTPAPGNRFLAVFVNEEMFGSNQSMDPRMWGFDETAFRAQIGDQVYAPDTQHDPVDRIKEFDNLQVYHKTVTPGPFSYEIIYTGHSPATGGFVAQRLGWLRMGEGNSWDGYILFEVPASTRDEDVRLLGGFASFGQANWKLG